MTKKFPLLLLDADVVIELHCLGIWDQVVERCDVHVARSIVDDEALYFEDKQGDHGVVEKVYSVHSERAERDASPVFSVPSWYLRCIYGAFSTTPPSLYFPLFPRIPSKRAFSP